MLASKWLKAPLPNRPRITFLNDIILGQRMLYLAIRIQDDLFDGHTKAPSLIFSSDNLLIEAESLFSRHFPKDSRFWTEYRNCLRATTCSIVEADEAERSARTDASTLLDLHAKVCSVFKIGSIAVCARSANWIHKRTVSLFCDEMAKAGQIVDDLADLEEDLSRNRNNYVAKRLDHSNTRDALRDIFGEIYSHVDRAAALIKRLNLQQGDAFMSGYRALITRIEAQVIRSRIDSLFGPLLKRSQRTSDKPIPPNL